MRERDGWLCLPFDPQLYPKEKFLLTAALLYITYRCIKMLPRKLKELLEEV